MNALRHAHYIAGTLNGLMSQLLGASCKFASSRFYRIELAVGGPSKSGVSFGVASV